MRLFWMYCCHKVCSVFEEPSVLSRVVQSHCTANKLTRLSNLHWLLSISWQVARKTAQLITRLWTLVPVLTTNPPFPDVRLFFRRRDARVFKLRLILDLMVFKSRCRRTLKWTFWRSDARCANMLVRRQCARSGDKRMTRQRHRTRHAAPANRHARLALATLPALGANYCIIPWSPSSTKLLTTNIHVINFFAVIIYGKNWRFADIFWWVL